jgi:hypothetical protein
MPVAAWDVAYEMVRIDDFQVVGVCQPEVQVHGLRTYDKH